jgi:CHAD domain-containing protein
MCADLSLEPAPGPAAAAAVAKHGRSAVKQLERADAESYPDAVHEFRKHVKQMRSLARLIRPWLGDEGHRVNDDLRAAANLLSGARDATVAVETLDAMADGAVPHPWPALRGRLSAREAAANDELRRHADRASQACELVGDVSEAAETWLVDDVRAEELASTLARWYRRGREALAALEEDPTTEGFHELRKRAKDLRYQVEFVAPARPELFGVWVDELHRLTDLVGDDHDLANLDMLAEPLGGLQPKTRAELDERRAELQRDAIDLARRIYAAPPKSVKALVGSQLAEYARQRKEGRPVELSSA